MSLSGSTAVGAGLVNDGELDVVSRLQVCGQPVECLPGVRRYSAGKSVEVDDVEVGILCESPLARLVAAIENTVAPPPCEMIEYVHSPDALKDRERRNNQSSKSFISLLRFTHQEISSP